MSFYQQGPYWSNHPQGSHQWPQHLVQYGSHGQDVRAVQQKLSQLGYNVGAVDGIFGPKTLAAVKAFQGSHGLTVDGIVGPKTWRSLFGATTSPTPPQTHLIQYGSQGGAVRVIQQELIVKGYNIGPIDGIFGPKTLAAVRAFQASHGLVVDGIVGPKTWNALVGIP